MANQISNSLKEEMDCTSNNDIISNLSFNSKSEDENNNNNNNNNNILRISMIEHRPSSYIAGGCLQYLLGNKHTLYVMKIEYNKYQWFISKRYSEFLELHETLQKYDIRLRLGQRSILTFPHKYNLMAKLGHEKNLINREFTLLNYLVQVLLIETFQHSLKEIYEFLEIPQHLMIRTTTTNNSKVDDNKGEQQQHHNKVEKEEGKENNCCKGNDDDNDADNDFFKKFATKAPRVIGISTATTSNNINNKAKKELYRINNNNNNEDGNYCPEQNCNYYMNMNMNNNQKDSIHSDSDITISPRMKKFDNDIMIDDDDNDDFDKLLLQDACDVEKNNNINNNTNTVYVVEKNKNEEEILNDLYNMLLDGVQVIKHCRHSKPRKRMIFCDTEFQSIYWCAVPPPPTTTTTAGNTATATAVKKKFNKDQSILINDIKEIRHCSEMDPTSSGGNKKGTKTLRRYLSHQGSQSSSQSAVSSVAGSMSMNMSVASSTNNTNNTNMNVKDYIDENKMAFSLICSDRTLDIEIPLMVDDDNNNNDKMGNNDIYDILYNGLKTLVKTIKRSTGANESSSSITTLEKKKVVEVLSETSDRIGSAKSFGAGTGTGTGSNGFIENDDVSNEENNFTLINKNIMNPITNDITNKNFTDTHTKKNHLKPIQMNSHYM